MRAPARPKSAPEQPDERGYYAVVGAIAINILVACRGAMPDWVLRPSLEATEKSLLPLFWPLSLLWAGRGLSRQKQTLGAAVVRPERMRMKMTMRLPLPKCLTH